MPVSSIYRIKAVAEDDTAEESMVVNDGDIGHGRDDSDSDIVVVPKDLVVVDEDDITGDDVDDMGKAGAVSVDADVVVCASTTASDAIPGADDGDTDGE
ncbi:hypothetical protein EDD11_005323 [Mortierella claussenii]|nr:hypothetical protein EDD11_005323 [Mortierella claussenii]